MIQNPYISSTDSASDTFQNEGMRRLKKKLKPLILMALPLLIVPMISLIFGEEVTQKVLIYSAPLLVLPLVIKLWAKSREREGG